VWLNGHEWAKRQADRTGLGYRSLANGFAAYDDTAALQGSVTGSGRRTCEEAGVDGAAPCPELSPVVVVSRRPIPKSLGVTDRGLDSLGRAWALK
jgi:hypothetical protein